MIYVLQVFIILLLAIACVLVGAIAVPLVSDALRELDTLRRRWRKFRVPNVPKEEQEKVRRAMRAIEGVPVQPGSGPATKFERGGRPPGH
jgi:hypothetical protein